jgi:4-hydroxy 2-oxovalerate aldolase
MKKTILISDPTLRDGNHAVRHQLSRENIAAYATAADEAGVPIIEVGHGNGIGASSILVGEAKETDRVLLETARENIKTSKLGIHIIPGFATIERDISLAIEVGVDVFRVASHCTEADITQKHISYLREQGKEVYGVLMMSHMTDTQTLTDEALKMQSYGAEGIIIMDSAGHYLPTQVKDRIKSLRQVVKGHVGFHGHNNMGMAVANSLVAIENGATLLDGCARGFGAGAGNTQIETLVAVLQREGYETGIDLYKLLDAADLAEKEIIPQLPVIRSTSIVSGMAGVFSGFLRHVDRISKEQGVDPRDLFFRLGEKKVVAGQEDVIIEVALELAREGKNL